MFFQDLAFLTSKRHGNHTIAVVKGTEKYETIKESFQQVFKEVNDVIEQGSIEVDGQATSVELFLGGDYKFLLLMMGLSGATSNYCCIYCKIHKSERYDMSKPDDFYHSGSMKRTLEEMFLLGKTTHNFCCVFVPLLNIPLDHIVPDELHLLLRILDRLIKNILDEVIQWDKMEVVVNGTKAQEHLNQLISTINSCGVTFTVWEKTNSDGTSGVHDWTSLMGDEMKHLLQALPEKLNGVLHPETSPTVVRIWKDFGDLYFQYINSWKIPVQPNDSFQTKAKSWINLYTSLCHRRIGYKFKDVTPYMHIMVYHIPFFINKYSTVKQFSGQGVEKNNDDARQVVLSKSNNWDSPADVLRSEHRLWMLREKESKHRSYQKKDENYWENGIKEMRSKRRRISDDIEGPCTETTSIRTWVDMTAKELKEELLKLGVSIFGKKRKAGLLKMLVNIITENTIEQYFKLLVYMP